MSDFAPFVEALLKPLDGSWEKAQNNFPSLGNNGSPVYAHGQFDEDGEWMEEGEGPDGFNLLPAGGFL